ncbi:MAG: hypothetical protein ACI4VG_01580 [Lachnospiraceae bacterium]
MEKEQFWDQSLDLRRLILILARRLWLVAVGILAGAAAGACSYLLYTGITDGDPLYRVSSDYYISFNFSEFQNSTDYYNAYTWDGILRNDIIVDYALTLLPKDVEKSMVQQAVSGEMLGDYRILTVHVSAADPVLAQEIAQAYHKAMVYFGETRDMLDHIEVWSRGEAERVQKYTKTGNAAFLGGLIGGLAALFGVLLYLLLEDGIYVEEDAKCFGLPVYGILTVNEEDFYQKIFQDNIAYAFGTKPVVTWDVERVPDKADYDELRKAQVLLLAIPWGRKNKAKTRRLLELLAIQDCETEGLVIVGARESFLKAYYGREEQKVGKS